MIKSGAPKDAVSDMGETPLNLTFSKNDVKEINTLLISGTRTGFYSEYGETTLCKALKKGIILKKNK